MDYHRFLNECRSEYPAFRLDAVPHGFTAMASKLFSLFQVEKTLFIRVHPDIAKQFELKDVAELADKAKRVKDSNAWTHEQGRIWYLFDTDYLNLTVGYHQYRLTFQNTSTGDPCLLYFSYIIQDNDPDKPYYYMAEARKYLDSDSDSEEDTDSDSDSDTDKDTDSDTEQE